MIIKTDAGPGVGVSNFEVQFRNFNFEDEEETEDGEESVDSEHDDGEGEIVAVIESDSGNEDSHIGSEDESDEMHAPQIYQGSVVTSRSGS